MENNAKKQAKKFLKEYRLTTVTLPSLKKVLEQQGYTLVEFNTIFNDENVATLIEALGLEHTIETSRAFTYADAYRRLVFLNEDLSDAEKLVVLAHEEGHIYCNHFGGTPVIGNDVAEEHEANEFSHYILTPAASHKWKTAFKKHKIAVGAVLLVCLFAVAGICIYSRLQTEAQYFGEFYITSTGNKYHKEGCIFVKDKTNVHRMTVEEFESGEYEPCGICLPEGEKDTSDSSD